MPYQEEALGQTWDPLERLGLLAAVGMHQCLRCPRLSFPKIRVGMGKEGLGLRVLAL